MVLGLEEVDPAVHFLPVSCIPFAWGGIFAKLGGRSREFRTRFLETRIPNRLSYVPIGKKMSFLAADATSPRDWGSWIQCHYGYLWIRLLLLASENTGVLPVLRGYRRGNDVPCHLHHGVIRIKLQCTYIVVSSQAMKIQQLSLSAIPQAS
jgi:hypothetical protein